MTAASALARVRRGDLCAGCGACAAIAPGRVRMTEERGLLRPEETAPLGAAEDAAIARICPGLALEQDAEDRPDHPLWGPVIGVYAGHATDPALRHAGASGGGLSAVLVHLVESGAVDAVIQIAPDPDDPVANTTVISRTGEEIRAAAGSRYAPSAPLAGLGPLLESAERYAFVGKPCDVAALRSWAREEPRIDRRIPWMLSFFCAGVPRRAGAEEILERLGVAPADVAGFRYRGNGWPGRATARLADGTERTMSYAESWGGILSRHVQFRCKICPDGTGGFADLVCADAWETDARGYPLFEERPGVSLVMSRTERAEALLREAASAGRLALGPFPTEAIAAIQPGQTGRKRVLLARLGAIALCLRPVPRYRGFQLWRAARGAGRWALLRNFLGTCRRILVPRRGER